MSNTPSKASSEVPMSATSTAQQGDNIAHALAGAGGGLLSMTLTLEHHPSYPALFLTQIADIRLSHYQRVHKSSPNEHSPPHTMLYAGLSRERALRDSTLGSIRPCLA